MNLTDLLLSLQPAWWHRIMRWMSIPVEGFHDFMPGFCVCGEVGNTDIEQEFEEAA